jgi:hypothetical protein
MAQLKRLVGFIGVARSGKDEAAKALTDRGYIRTSYGDTVKGFYAEFVKVHYGLNVFTEDTAEKAQFRAILEHGGEVLMRRVRSYDAALRDFGARLPAYPIQQIIDLATLVSRARKPLLVQYETHLQESYQRGQSLVNPRVMSEAANWHSCGGLICEIVRPGVIAASAWEQEYIEGMRAEGYITKRIDNDSTVAELQNKVLDLAGFDASMVFVDGALQPRGSVTGAV